MDIDAMAQCDEEWKIAFRYKEVGGDWTTKYWYTMTRMSGVRPSSDGLPLHTRNSIYYVYAENADGTETLDDGSHNVSIGGRTYLLLKRGW